MSAASVFAGSRPPRYSVRRSESQLWISIPPRRQLWRAGALTPFVFAAAAFLAILLLGCATQEVHYPMLAAFAGLVLVVWIACGAYMIAWELAGHERITVSSDALLHSCSIGSLLRSRRYALDRVERIRVPLDFGAWWEEHQARRLQWPKGMIEFRYEGEARRLGRYLTVSEAQELLALIEARLVRR